MAAAPGWKIYDSFGTYQSSCKEVEAAAAVATFYGEGSTIGRDIQNIVSCGLRGSTVQKTETTSKG